MAFSNLNKDNLYRLFKMININEKDNITDIKLIIVHIQNWKL